MVRATRGEAPSPRAGQGQQAASAPVSGLCPDTPSCPTRGPWFIMFTSCWKERTPSRGFPGEGVPCPLPPAVVAWLQWGA